MRKYSWHRNIAHIIGTNIQIQDVEALRQYPYYRICRLHSWNTIASNIEYDKILVLHSRFRKPLEAFISNVAALNIEMT